MNINHYIESGILEIYILGLATKAESEEVESLAMQFPEVRSELDAISSALEKYAAYKQPQQNIKPLLMATIDYSERLENGEPRSFPPELKEGAKPTDYAAWLDRTDMQAPPDFEEVFAKIIGHTPEMTSAIVWMKHQAPEEVHGNEYEKFLILEGTCDITISGKLHSLVPGDYLAIPLHAAHHVKVTSLIPCKVLLQRVAA